MIWNSGYHISKATTPHRIYITQGGALDEIRHWSFTDKTVAHEYLRHVNSTFRDAPKRIANPEKYQIITGVTQAELKLLMDDVKRPRTTTTRTDNYKQEMVHQENRASLKEVLK